MAKRDKIQKYISPSDVDDLLSIINSFCQFESIKAVAPSSAIRDPKDLYLLSLAETICADFIVSGDADLTDLERYKRTRILKLADFKAMMPSI